MQRVINFSGGKTSAYMTIMEYKPGDIVLFCDTGREHPKTYKFIHDFEAHEGIKVTWVRYMGKKINQIKRDINKRIKSYNPNIRPTIDFDLEDLAKQLEAEINRVKSISPFDLMLEDRGNKTLPNRMRRFCTDSLKIITARQFCVSLGHTKYENLIGFRADEPKRVLGHKEKLKSVKTVFPLYEKNITKEVINEYWLNKPYTLEIPRILGNCTLCFLKGKNAIISILRDFPELADQWIKDEEMNLRVGHTYLPEVSIRQLRTIAQNNLFKGYDLGEMNPAYDCACTA